MTESKEEGKKCAYECRDEGFDCDWYCVTEDEKQLVEKVKAHKNQYHSIWTDNKGNISEYVKRPTSEMPE